MCLCDPLPLRSGMGQQDSAGPALWFRSYGRPACMQCIVISRAAPCSVEVPEHCTLIITSCWQVVAKTDGYSGSDMRNLIQEACQGPVRDAVARVGEAVATLSDADLRPVSGSGFGMQCSTWLGHRNRQVVASEQSSGNRGAQHVLYVVVGIRRHDCCCL
jgi:hypothetical protein